MPRLLKQADDVHTQEMSALSVRSQQKDNKHQLKSKCL